MQAGVSPRGIFQALNIDSSCVDAVEKAYNPAEPRVPAGSGRTSGEWTNTEASGEDAAAGAGIHEEGAHGSSFLGRMPPPPASFMGELDAAEVLELGLYVARIAMPVGAAAAVFGLLFIPSPNNVHVEGEVPEIPGLRYSWNRDEAKLFLKYDRPGVAQRTVAIQLDGDKLRDQRGEVVGHIIGGNRVAIDAIAVLPDLVKQDEPRLCPAHEPDVAGSDQGKTYEENKSRQYEDFVKLLINPPPDGPTPSGFVYYLPNPAGGEPVSYDDCKNTNGFMFEIKGEGNANLTSDLPGVMEQRYLKQAARQLAASGGRPIVWIFAEEDAAVFARKLFDSKDDLKRITVGHVPWIRSSR